MTETLQDTVQGRGEGGGGQGEGGPDVLELVKQAIRKFFQKSDPEGRGLVNEERFRAFTR